MSRIGKKATNLIVWASAYVNVIVFALCGGYVWFKSGDETVKNETKKALIVTLIFTAVGMIQSFVGQCLSLFNVSYGSDLYTVHQKIANIVTLAQIVTYAVFALLAFFKNENAAVNTNGSCSACNSASSECEAEQSAQDEVATGDSENNVVADKTK